MHTEVVLEGIQDLVYEVVFKSDTSIFQPFQHVQPVEEI